ALQLSKNYSKTNEFQNEASNDFRTLANAKKEHLGEFRPYIQMFDDKHGFLSNLSILDLLFMEGPNAISFLQKNS
ncbi:MAG: hypothetical protein JKZ00_04080, partial [Flavobacteriaceae bacterium]|nr:hypothetical protein [Flavobacteriaceae bacterium]